MQRVRTSPPHLTWSSPPGPDSNQTRRTIYKLWQNINKLELGNLSEVRTKQAPSPLPCHAVLHTHTYTYIGLVSTYYGHCAY